MYVISEDPHLHTTDQNSVSSNPIFSLLQFCALYPSFFEPIICSLPFIVRMTVRAIHRILRTWRRQAQRQWAYTGLRLTYTRHWTVHWNVHEIYTGQYLRLCTAVYTVHCTVPLDCTPDVSTCAPMCLDIHWPTQMCTGLYTGWTGIVHWDVH